MDLNKRLVSSDSANIYVLEARQIDLMGEISGDRNRVHFDPDAARAAGFPGGRIAHGILVASLIIETLRRNGWINRTSLESQAFGFRAPVYIGDQVRGTVQFVDRKRMEGRILVELKTNVEKYEEGKGWIVAIEGQSTIRVPEPQWLVLKTNSLIPDSHKRLEDAPEVPPPAVVLAIDPLLVTEVHPHPLQMGRVITFNKEGDFAQIIPASKLWAGERMSITLITVIGTEMAKTPMLAGLFSALLGNNFPGAIYLGQDVRYVDSDWSNALHQNLIVVGKILQANQHHRLQDRAVVVLETQIQTPDGRLLAVGEAKLLVLAEPDIYAALPPAPKR